VLDSVVVVVLWVVGTGVSLTVVQAVNENKAAAARHGMMSVFISCIIYVGIVVGYIYAQIVSNRCENAMGSNPTR
jgi:phosphotransferase system  glucose/maltose/N-acetylglucosamine-specific IIC component